MKNNKIPILLVAFRRPKETLKVLREIKKYYPNDLYFFVDTSTKDQLLVKEVQNLLLNDDYAKNIHKNFQKTNLGCGLGPVTAIDWVLSKEKYVIILEDDCVPLNGFFEFMEWWLKIKEKDNKCFMISGNNFPILTKKKITVKTKISLTHGWGTWKRAWEGYDFNISDWNNYKKLNTNFIPFYAIRYRWKKIFDRISKDCNKSYWDYQWQYHIWSKNGYSIQPPINLVRNIGYNVNATHTVNKNDWRANIPEEKLSFNFKEQKTDFKLLNEINNVIISLNIFSYILRFFFRSKY